MEKKVDKKFTWVIGNFSSLSSAKISSDKFDVRGCKWYLSAYPKGYNVENQLSVYLEVADYGTLPSGWRRHARYLLTVVNQHSEKLSRQRSELQQWFDETRTSWGYPSFISLDELNAKDSGFMVNGELKIVVELELLEVIGKVEVNGFHLLPSQAESVSRIFERHPEFASEFLPKNPNLRTCYISFLLGLIETMCQPPNKLSKDDLSSASFALGFMKNEGFKLHWLERKLDEVCENKENELANETRLRGMEEELKELKQKYLDMEVLVDKEKAKMSAAKAPLSFDDVV